MATPPSLMPLRHSPPHPRQPAWSAAVLFKTSPRVRDWLVVRSSSAPVASSMHNARPDSPVACPHIRRAGRWGARRSGIKEGVGGARPLRKDSRGAERPAGPILKSLPRRSRKATRHRWPMPLIVQSPAAESRAGRGKEPSTAFSKSLVPNIVQICRPPCVARSGTVSRQLVLRVCFDLPARFSGTNY